MGTNIDLNYASYTYVSKVIDFYSNEIAADKKFFITEKDAKTRFTELAFYLEKWGNIELSDFVSLLNYINKNALPKYLFQNNLFSKNLNQTDFIASVQLNFFNAEAVKNKYADLEIYYNIFHSLFGKVLIASISDYVCLIYFLEDDNQAENLLKTYFEKAQFVQKSKNVHLEALEKINNHENDVPLQVLVHASPLQEQVWKQLVLLPYKNIYTYGEIAEQIQEKN
ncbi:hypothetical protein K5I29_02020 [Flavobacterium agricola]|uniref:Uncharacterized protein n=1 Tax=Flavobacterium agricola TaxID=2870839 RepID=A0ABY6LZR1_9FLAO|nr:hypothetical protein [Flavobacterium agricola]UYW01724.1 hypothetical protein K5I29_02020 [Flavobacterium agricola]